MRKVSSFDLAFFQIPALTRRLFWVKRIRQGTPVRFVVIEWYVGWLGGIGDEHFHPPAGRGEAGRSEGEARGETAKNRKKSAERRAFKKRVG